MKTDPDSVFEVQFLKISYINLQLENIYFNFFQEEHENQMNDLDRQIRDEEFRRIKLNDVLSR